MSFLQNGASISKNFFFKQREGTKKDLEQTKGSLKELADMSIYI